MGLMPGPFGGVLCGMPFTPGHLVRGLSETLFPPICAHCDGIVGHGENLGALRHVCAKCEARIEFVGEPCCSTCGHPFYGELAGERVCEHCEDLAPAFNEGRTAVLFRGAARALIHELKYHGARYVLRDIETILRRSPRVLELARGATLVPVPLHPRKERERGYNQGRLVAECLARAAGGEASGTRVKMLLRRVVDTVSQTALDRATRRKNLKDAFSLVRGARVDAAAKHVIVDDVFTTGSTLNSCARVLRRAGCENLFVITFGHG
ncbi:ComF family protein [Ereboglobus sp. PH5-5]|nr:ComF family protein [Ereboglobus sp. PH5-5]